MRHSPATPQSNDNNVRMPVRSEAAKAAIRLLDKWLADESGYDEDVWPRVKVAIEENRLSYRPRFGD
jgi:hypothetical protein